MAALRYHPLSPPAAYDEYSSAVQIAVKRHAQIRTDILAWLDSDAAQGWYRVLPRAVAGGGYCIVYAFTDDPTAVAFRLRWS